MKLLRNTQLALASLFLAFSPCANADEKADGKEVKFGDPLDISILQEASTLKGEIPKVWEEDKLYLLECWATKCGPCIQAMPHLKELEDKFKDKDLEVLAIHVFEKDKKIVEEFLKKRGDTVPFPVAFVGEGEKFETEILRPAGINGIPETLVVKNGQIIFWADPRELTEDILKGVLAGGEKEKEAVKQIRSIHKGREELAKKDAEEMASFIERVGPDYAKKWGQLMADQNIDGLIQLIDKTLKENGKLTQSDKYKLRTDKLIGLSLTASKEVVEKELDDLVKDFPESFIGKDPDKLKKEILDNMPAKEAEKGQILPAHE